MGQAAERGLYMIEIIREESFDSEQEKRELPKNIRQIAASTNTHCLPIIFSKETE